ncbi:T6SS effector BTH_I2691 family protein [Paraburkholderia saeva]|uniref:T6SS effector BTH_I2691 family protein n=1 Tax=Paraburkholderia saeva TaxID=2777537 RepID=UPI001DBEA9DA|nr:T6SS effector BTH_I2691 family protein [Paraburkholderia saeva]CAG4928538.1 hypothetical protein R70241_05742 [Paraburkholderia saeva]CAG4928617.1 hypothetical protein R52603_05724 [Paraburkholderia saeva]
MTNSPIPPCPFCEKQGLPILLTRYGIAPEKAFMARQGKPPVTKAAPKAASTIGDPDPAIPLGKTSEAFYTVRNLRGGYVYVYYEVTKSWEGYQVDDKGRLAQVSLDNYMPPKARPFDSSCTQNMQKVANASLLTIHDPATAGKVWFGFSDAWWTPAVRKDNESESVRQLHMRCVDVQGWYNNNHPAKAQPHTSPIANVDTVVADYAMSGMDSSRLFFWNPFQPQSVHEDSLAPPRAQSLKAESQRLLKDKGLVVVLEDPVAILREISAYIDRRWSNFLSQNDTGDSVHPDQTWSRKSKLSSALETLRLHVEREAEDGVYGDARAFARQTQANGGLAFLVADYRKATQPILDQTVTQPQLEAARAARWGTYAKLFDPVQRKSFEDRYAKASALHDAEYTTPLANAHAGWLRSAKLSAVLDHHFDMQDINSGIAFPGVALACMSGTGGLGACMQVYSDWINEALEKSPIWRTLLLNHKPLLQAVDQASGSSDGPFQNPDDWTNLFTVYTAAQDKIKALGAAVGATGVKANLIETVDVLPALLLELGNLPKNLLEKGGKPATAMLATLGMRSGQPVRWVQVAGTRRELYKSILDVMGKSQAGRSISLGNLQTSLTDQLRTLEIEGVPLDDKIQFWTVVFDEDAQTGLANGRVTPAQRGDALGKTVKMVTVQKFNEGTVGKVIELAVHPGVIASVGLFLAGYGYHKAASADDSMKHLQVRAMEKIAALYTAGAGSLLDLVRTGAKVAIARKIPMLSPWLAGRLGEKGFQIWEGTGFVAGGVGMVVLGVIDVGNTFEVVSRNQRGMVLLYATNGIAELYVGGYGVAVGLNLIFRFGWVWASAEFNPIIFGLTLVILVVSVIIEVEKDPPTMDWVRQCLWGKENNYAEAEEMDNFKKALNG